MILIANHQSEADPATFALLLEAAFPKLAQGAWAWAEALRAFVCRGSRCLCVCDAGWAGRGRMSAV